MSSCAKIYIQSRLLTENLSRDLSRRLKSGGHKTSHRRSN